jgi:hypothetical protein
VCKQPFIPKRADARTCSNKCRQALLRRRRRFDALFPKGSPACDIDWEHDKDFDAEPDDLQRRRAADWQLFEALRLAREFALLRPGTEPVEISKRRRRIMPRVREVIREWKQLLAKLRATARTERADPRARGPLPNPWRRTRLRSPLPNAATHSPPRGTAAQQNAGRNLSEA